MTGRPDRRQRREERPTVVAEFARLTAILVAVVSLAIPVVAVRTPRGLLVAATLLGVALLAWRGDVALRRAQLGGDARPAEIIGMLARDKVEWVAAVAAACCGVLALMAGGGANSGQVPSIPSSTSTTRPLGEQLRSALLTVDDLPDGWHPVPFQSGTRLLDADEFCGAKPSSDADAEEDAVFAGGPLDTRRLYSTAAHFPPGRAQAFLAEVRRLARSCRSWPYRRTRDAAPQLATIARLDTSAPFGEESVRVVVGGTTPEVDFIYLRRGDRVGLVAYSVQDLPGIGGDEHTDPAFAEELGKVVDHRLRAITPAARHPGIRPAGSSVAPGSTSLWGPRTVLAGTRKASRVDDHPCYPEACHG